MAEQSESSVMPWVTCSRVIMFELENTGTKIARFRSGVGNINAMVNEENTQVGNGILGTIRNGSRNDVLSEFVCFEAFEDVLVELL